MKSQDNDLINYQMITRGELWCAGGSKTPTLTQGVFQPGYYVIEVRYNNTSPQYGEPDLNLQVELQVNESTMTQLMHKGQGFCSFSCTVKEPTFFGVRFRKYAGSTTLNLKLYSIRIAHFNPVK